MREDARSTEKGSRQKEMTEDEIRIGQEECTSEVVLCARCQGRGIWLDPSLLDATIIMTREDLRCEKCDGTGRLVKITRVRYERFSDK